MTIGGGFRDMDKHEDRFTTELDYAAIGRRIRTARKKPPQVNSPLIVLFVHISLPITMARA